MTLKQILPSSSHFHLLTIIGATLSIIFSIGFVFPLKAKKSNYARIMKLILVSESLVIFAEMLIVTGQHKDYNMTETICSIFNYLTFNSLLNKDPSCYMLTIANISLYFSNQAFTILLNIFICLEIILILKNPIAQLKSRLKTYFLISTFTAMIVFFISFSTITKESECAAYSLTNIFMVLVPVYINFAIYLIFLIFGIISSIFLFFRFCVGKPLLQNLKNWFVLRHFLYIIIYILCFLPNKVNEFLVILGYDQDFLFLEWGIILNCFMGFIMFLIRVSETNFYYKIFCRHKVVDDNSFNNSNTSLNESLKQKNEAFFDNHLTVIISRNMNLEFMCCILYGLSEIFMKPERRNNKISADMTATPDLSMTLNYNYADRSLLMNNNKNISRKDFHRAKSHKIRYKKIFADNIDFDKLEVEVMTARGSNSKNNLESDYNDGESQSQIYEDTSSNQANHDAIVIEYCPRVFRELRKLDDIDGYELERALNPISNQEGMSKMRESEGKSGSFFFFSHDSKFIIKTITNNELNTMLGKFMQNYYEHISEHQDSLLTRIYGIYSIVIKGVSKINIILMQNLINFKSSRIKRIFDLKGSRVERITKNIERCDKMKTLKDLDYLWMIKIEEDMVDLNFDHCDILQNTLANDLKMLREVEVMDYSLLLVVTYLPKPKDPDYEDVLNLFSDKRYQIRTFRSRNGKYMYILGIIDYLQKFNVAKFFENKYKSIVYGNQIKFVSAVDPMIYSDRLLNFAKEFIFISHGH